MPPAPEDASVAVITGESSFKHKFWTGLDPRVQILAVDGKATGSSWGDIYPYTVKVSPGRHEVRARFMLNGAYAIASFEIDAEAGKSYLIRHRLVDGWTVRLWAVDEATGEPVGRSLDK